MESVSILQKGKARRSCDRRDILAEKTFNVCRNKVPRISSKQRPHIGCLAGRPKILLQRLDPMGKWNELMRPVFWPYVGEIDEQLDGMEVFEIATEHVARTGLTRERVPRLETRNRRRAPNTGADHLNNRGVAGKLHERGAADQVFELKSGQKHVAGPFAQQKLIFGCQRHRIIQVQDVV